MTTVVSKTMTDDASAGSPGQLLSNISPSTKRAGKPQHSSSGHSRNGRTIAETPQRDKEGRLPACEECRSRKVKCDALLPECTPCQKSGRECIGRDKMPNVSRSLIYDLQQKVKDLEGKLAASESIPDSNHQPSRYMQDQGAQSEGSGTGAERGRQTKRRRLDSDLRNSGPSDTDAQSSSPSSSPSGSQTLEPSPNDLIQQSSTIFESLASDMAASAQHQQPALLPRRSVQTLNDDEATALAALTKHYRERNLSPNRVKRRSSSSASRQRSAVPSSHNKTDSTEPQLPAIPTLPYPKSRSGRMNFISAHDRSFFDLLISKYLNYMNGALPVFNQVTLRQMATQVYEEDRRLQAALHSEAQNSDMPPPQPSAPSPADRASLAKDRYLVLMVLAIALASLSRRHQFSSDLGKLGHQYWSEAQSMFPANFRFPDLHKLRGSLLQIQYACLVPTAGSVWELSGLAMRLVTELNLHFDRDYDSITQTRFGIETIDMRRRLFWTSYCLDRSLAVALARPPGLSDAWIHVQLPSLLSDQELLHLENDPARVAGDQVDPLKQTFRAHIALRRIQSEILCRLHSVNPRDYALDDLDSIPMRQSLAVVMNVGPPTPNVEWQTRMMAKLCEWKTDSDQSKSSFPQVSSAESDQARLNQQGSNVAPFVTQDWIDINFHLTASLLFRPSPNNPRPDQNGLRQAFIASGHAMKIYKNMHRNMTINFPWLATHHLFISGLTHLNSLEKLSRSGVPCPQPIVDVVFNIQGCASTLQALTSRDDGYGARIRDTFDTASSAVLRTVLETPSQPSSLYSQANDFSSSQSGAHAVPRDTSFDAIFNEAGVPAASYTHSSPISTQLRGQGSRHDVRRGSDQEALLQATQHPTWLSDSTWNSINAIGSAPPPGSTILVAAPPRSSRNFTPISSDRSTQNSILSQPGAHADVSTTSYPYASTVVLPPVDTMRHSEYVKMPMGGHNVPMHGSSGIPSSYATQQDQSAPSSSNFGFHDYLLQPYDGGSDGNALSFDGLGDTTGSLSLGQGLTASPFGTSHVSSPYPHHLFGEGTGSHAQNGQIKAGLTGSNPSLNAPLSVDADSWLNFLPLQQAEPAQSAPSAH